MGKYKCGKIYKLTVSDLKIVTDQPRKLMDEVLSITRQKFSLF
ncbi:MAG: hypothetical protein RBR51_11385 [Candidatus Cloacimonadaceae bacterium]|jgi:hypothetical protein|nr:hypothetical protein [Candidatus Cloacimonadaceae bacterium]